MILQELINKHMDHVCTEWDCPIAGPCTEAEASVLAKCLDVATSTLFELWNMQTANHYTDAELKTLTCDTIQTAMDSMLETIKILDLKNEKTV